MINFKTDESLGKVVAKTQLSCSIGIKPIKDVNQLRFAAGGNKFSQLCSFIFDSANPKAEYPRFQIAFVCKLRSEKYRRKPTNGEHSVFNTTGSQWYIFKKINSMRIDVLNKQALLVNYGFDIDKFFDSDLFQKTIPRFQQTLKNGIHQAEEFTNSLKTDAEKDEALRYIDAIKSVIPTIKNHNVNDKYYKLNDLDAISDVAKAANDQASSDAALKAKFDKIHQSADDAMKSAKEYSDKAAKKDYIYQKLHSFNDSELSEDNETMYKCKVVKKAKDGKTIWSVVQISGNKSVASFKNKDTADKFAKDYPKMKIDNVKNEDESDNKIMKKTIKEWNDTHLPKGRVGHHDTGLPIKYWVAIDEYNEGLSNYGFYVDEHLNKKPVANNSTPSSTTDLAKAIEIAKKAQRKWPTWYIILAKDDHSRGVQTQKNHLRGGQAIDCWLPKYGYWRNGVVDSDELSEADVQATRNGKPQTLADVVDKFDDIAERYKNQKKSPVVVKMKDGTTYDITGVLMANGNAVIFAGDKAKLSEEDDNVQGDRPTNTLDEETLKQQELDDAIEEGLEEIYR